MMGDLLWQPAPDSSQSTALGKYWNWLEETKSLQFQSYQELHAWSIAEPEVFWETILHYFKVIYEGSYINVIDKSPMPHTRWFSGLRLNYAEQIFQNSTTERAAIIYTDEAGTFQEISWQELKERTAALQHFMLEHGFEKGQRVAAYLPAIPEATIAMLATTGLGGIWASTSPDFGVNAVIDRFAQIEPTFLLVVTSYQYGGKVYDRTEAVNEILKGLPSVKQVIYIGAETNLQPSWNVITSRTTSGLQFNRVDFNHPLWILYSSGTTGLPKAITHCHGGILLEQLKYGAFHNNFQAGDRCFWYTTTGWMMWNYLHGSLLAGGTMVLYNGSPGWPDLNILWELAAKLKITHFGTSAGYLLACMKENLSPGKDFALGDLKSLSSTGSTLPAEAFAWVYERIATDLWLVSMSGGTDVCSAFVGGNPLLPVMEGEIQCIALGCSLEAWNEAGESVLDEVGEMVITKPMPSMPVFFWNDPEFIRYTDSYFGMYAGIWRHGDWTTVTSRGTVIISGRSDATLNRGGVRIGTSEVYRAVDKIPEVLDSLIICLEFETGEFWMPLFVQLKPGFELTTDLRSKINHQLRTDFSPRHVPDEILIVNAIPYTLSGKKTETPVKKIFQGKELKFVITPGSLRNPESLAIFEDIYQNRFKRKS